MKAGLRSQACRVVHMRRLGGRIVGSIHGENVVGDPSTDTCTVVHRACRLWHAAGSRGFGTGVFGALEGCAYCRRTGYSYDSIGLRTFSREGSVASPSSAAAARVGMWSLGRTRRQQYDSIVTTFDCRRIDLALAVRGTRMLWSAYLVRCSPVALLQTC